MLWKHWAPRPVCTLNRDDESAMNRSEVGTISPFCSIKNKYYSSIQDSEYPSNRVARCLAAGPVVGEIRPLSAQFGCRVFSIRYMDFVEFPFHDVRE